MRTQGCPQLDPKLWCPCLFFPHTAFLCDPWLPPSCLDWHSSPWCNLTLQVLAFTVPLPQQYPMFTPTALSQPHWDSLHVGVLKYLAQTRVLIFLSHCSSINIQEVCTLDILWMHGQCGSSLGVSKAYFPSLWLGFLIYDVEIVIHLPPVLLWRWRNIRLVNRISCPL